MKKEKCVGRNCNHIFPVEDVINNMNENEATWNEWAGDGFLCGKCSRYLSIAEDISDAMSSQDMDIDMEYCLDSAYMLIDTYNCYKKIEEEENERRRKKMIEIKNKELASDLENVLHDLEHGEIYDAMKYLGDIIDTLKEKK